MDLNFEDKTLRYFFFSMDQLRSWNSIPFDSLITIIPSKKRKRGDLYFDNIFFLIEHSIYPLEVMNHCFKTISKNNLVDLVLGFTRIERSDLLTKFQTWISQNKELALEYLLLIRDAPENPQNEISMEEKIDIHHMIENICTKCKIQLDSPLQVISKEQNWNKFFDVSLKDLLNHVKSIKKVPSKLDDGLGNIITITVSRLIENEVLELLDSHPWIISSYFDWISSGWSNCPVSSLVHCKNIQVCMKHMDKTMPSWILKIIAQLVLFLSTQLQETSSVKKTKDFLNSILSDRLINFDMATSWLLQMSLPCKDLYSKFLGLLNEDTTETLFDHLMVLLRILLLMDSDLLLHLPKLDICKISNNSKFSVIFTRLMSEIPVNNHYKHVYFQLHVLNLIMSQYMPKKEMLEKFCDFYASLFEDLQQKTPNGDKQAKFHHSCLEICFYIVLIRLKSCTTLKWKFPLDTSRDGTWSYNIPLEFESMSLPCNLSIDQIGSLLISCMNHVLSSQTVLGRYILITLSYFSEFATKSVSNKFDFTLIQNKNVVKTLMEQMCHVLTSIHPTHVCEVLKAFGYLSCSKPLLEVILKSRFMHNFFECIQGKNFEGKPRNIIKTNGIIALQMLTENASSSHMTLLSEKILQAKGIIVLKAMLNWSEHDAHQYSVIESCIIILDRLSQNKIILASMISIEIWNSIVDLLKNKEFMATVMENMVPNMNELDPFFCKMIAFVQRYLDEVANKKELKNVSIAVHNLLDYAFSQHLEVVNKLLIEDIINLLLVVIKWYPKMDLIKYYSKLEYYEKANAIAQTYSQNDVIKILKFIK